MERKLEENMSLPWTIKKKLTLSYSQSSKYVREVPNTFQWVK